MNDRTILPVILSGGSGTRLWPASRPALPKQLLALTSEETMFQLTARRLKAGAHFAAPIVVANAAHADLIEAQLAAIGIADGLILLEPMGRNTAPAIALAALAATDPAAALLIMPSDHVIADIAAFHDAIAKAVPLVEQGWLVTFGITPNAPETGYGYIQLGEAMPGGAHAVARFVEKPGADRAAAMLAKGGFVWNAGIFMFRADTYLDALARYQPEMLAAARAAVEKALKGGNRLYPDADAFATCPADSIDYAVMERAERVACVPVSMGWSDVGSWDALHAISEKDACGNVIRGDVMSLGARDCLIHSDGPRVTVVDVEDLIVVVAGGDVMVLRRGQSQSVRKVTDALNAK